MHTIGHIGSTFLRTKKVSQRTWEKRANTHIRHQLVLNMWCYLPWPKTQTLQRHDHSLIFRMLSNRFGFKLILTATFNIWTLNWLICGCACVVCHLLFLSLYLSVPRMVFTSSKNTTVTSLFFYSRRSFLVSKGACLRVCLCVCSYNMSVGIHSHSAVNLNLMHLFLCWYSFFCIFFYFPCLHVSLSTFIHTLTHTCMFGYGSVRFCLSVVC